MALYNKIKITQDLLPSPKKLHYQINIRDIVRVCQGLQLANTKIITKQIDLINLWMHEVMRVFFDRLCDLNDQQIFVNLLIEVTISEFKLQYN